MEHGRGWITALFLASLALPLACERARRAREPGLRSPRAGCEAAVERARPIEPMLEEASAGREAVPAAERLGPAAADEQEGADPPTPERPGPGQALLRVRAVALETGASLAGIELGLYPGEGEDEEREWASSTQDDPARGVEGDDVLSGVDGRAELVVEAGHRYVLYGRGPSGLADEAELELAPLDAGAEQEAVLALPTEWTLEWHGRTVDGESERPLGGVEVVACAARAAEEGAEVELARGRSQGDGRVRLRLPAWEPAIARCALPGYFPGGARIDPEALSFDAPQALALRRPAALAVRVRSPDGRPAESIDVRVRVPPWGVIERMHGEFLQWSATTDAEGRGELPELPALADVFVRLERAGRTLEWTSMSERFQLEPGERRELEYTLPAGVRLSVRVRERAGAPLAGAALALCESGLAFDHPWHERFFLDRWVPAETIGIDGARLALLTTDPEGRAALDGLRPGSYWLSTAAEDLPAVAWPFRIGGDDPSAALELRLDRGLLVTGTVVGPDGRPVRGATLVLARDDGTPVGGNAWSGREGSFVLGPLLRGAYRVRAQGCDEPLFAPSEELAVEAGGAPVTLALTWGGRLRARAFGADGAELEEPHGELFRSGRFLTWLNEGEAGGLAPGAYDLWLTTDEGLAGVLRGLVVRARETLDVAVPVQPGATLVLPFQGSASSTGRMALEWEGLQLGWHWGRARVVPPGTLTVRFHAWGPDFEEHVVDTRTRTLAAGEAWSVAPPE